MSRQRKKLVIIGNGMAACRLLEELMQLAPELYDITVLSAEQHAGYNRVLLSPVLSGDSDIEAITTHPHSWYQARGIDLRTGTHAIEVKRRLKQVITEQGDVFAYDRLVFATGARPRRLDMDGAAAENMLTFRDLQDTERLLQVAKKATRAVVIGGGFLGIEAAEGLRQRGMHVTLLHGASHLLNRQLDAEAAGYLQRELGARGLSLILNARTDKLIRDDSGRVSAVQIQSGVQFDTDVVVQAIGIEPNVELARQCGLVVDRAIRVDDTLQTFDPSIYAVGECVEHRRRTFGLVAPLYAQARVCAAHLAEAGHRIYRYQDTPTRLKVSGISVYSAGEFEDTFGGSVLVLRDPAGGVYRRLVLRNFKLVGVVLVGDTNDALFYEKLMLEQTDLEALRPLLLFGQAWLSDEQKAALEQAA